MTKSRNPIFIFLVFLIIPVAQAVGQDQRVADSLALIYKSGNVTDSARLELLRNLAFNEIRDSHLGIRYAEELIVLAEKMGEGIYQYRGYLQKGNKQLQLGDLQAALESYRKGAEIARAIGYTAGEGSIILAIADTYAASNNFASAIEYYRKSIAILRKVKDELALATAINNAGDTFLNNKFYDSALVYFEESQTLFKKLNYEQAIAYTIGNIGMVYAHLGRPDVAENQINQAIQILEQREDYSPICIYLMSICDIYVEKGREQEAINYAERSLAIAQKYGLKMQISSANRKLAELYERSGELGKAYTYYKNHIVFRDSVNNLETVQQMADQRTKFEISRKQVEIDLLNQQRRNQRIILFGTIITSFLIIVLAVGLFNRYRFIKKTNAIIEDEQKRSDSLLLNILPQETVTELKEKGQVQAKKFDSVTVLFTDFKGFTTLSEQVSPEQLVRSVDYYFKEFDAIVSRYKLEKIKTIGDSYMCAGGLPSVNQTHATDVIRAAQEMIKVVDQSLSRPDDLTHFEIRIGVHTGPVVAGVVGSLKWQYDIWGDTVNVASRMESMSEPGRINLSETTYRLINPQFACSYRGEIAVKNRGHLKMYFLDTA